MLLCLGISIKALAQEASVLTLTVQAVTPSRLVVHDTVVTAATPGQPHDADPILSASVQSVILLQFDLRELPVGADVLTASLELWTDSRSAPLPLDVTAYSLARPWSEGATWLTAAPGVLWERPGAAGDTDRGDALSRQRLDKVGRWYGWDVTDAVRQWLMQPGPSTLTGTSFQVMLAADRGDVEYYLVSSEWREFAKRPRLIVHYRLPVQTVQVSGQANAPFASSKDRFPAMPYVMYDWRNRNWQAELPQRGPVGSHIEFTWEEVNPARGRFDWSRYDNYLRTARTQWVTLADGSLAPKPVMFTLMLAGSGEAGRFKDFTPAWVYNEMGDRPLLDGRPVGYVVQPEKCHPAAVPLYGDPTWQAALAATIAAFGARYDGDPQVAGIWIGAGLDDETQPAKIVGSCDYPARLEQLMGCDAYMKFLERLMGWYAAAFPHKPLWIQAAPAACAERSGAWSRRRIMSQAAALGIGYKANALLPDLADAVGYLESAGWQKMDTADRYAGQLPIAFEPAFSEPVGENDPVEYAYWMVHNALAHHASFIDLQPEWLDDLDKVPEVWSAVQDSLGRTAASAPAVWVVLRDAECELVMWPNSGSGCEPGDWDFYLRRPENLPGNGTVHLRESDLPAAAAMQPYGRHARRTDEASGNMFMSFDVDNRWQFAGQLPAAAGGRARYEVSVCYLDEGMDTWRLEYRDSQGVLRQATVNKGDSHRWRQVTWTLDDLSLTDAMPGRTDFRLNSAGDGDDVFHKVTVRGVWVAVATPTPSSASTPTPTFDATATVAPSPTFTPTPAEAATEPPTPTATPTPTPTATEAVTPTPTAVPATPTVAPTPSPEVTVTVTPGFAPTSTPSAAQADAVFSEPLALTPTTVPTARGDSPVRATTPGLPSRILAKIEALWPSGPQRVSARVYLFADQSLIPPPCGWEPTVRLWGAARNAPARLLGVGQKRMVEDKGRRFPAWDFMGLDVGALGGAGTPMHFFASVDGVNTVHNVVSIGQDVRTLNVAESEPTGLVRAPQTQVDAIINILWPHDGVPVAQAERANLTATIFAAGTRLAFPAGMSWTPTVRLHWAVNDMVDGTGGTGIIGSPREVSRNGIRYLVWDFNNVNVSAARNPDNRMVFWLSVDGAETHSSVWVHSVDGRPILLTADLPAASCQ